MENNSCIIYKDFLSPGFNSALFLHTAGHRELFNHTIVGDGEKGRVDENWRHSSYLAADHFEEYSQTLRAKVEEAVPDMIIKLGIPSFEISQIEIQLTSHNHGEFFKPHADNGKGKFKTRIITFVYYFNSVPKMFTGGQLLFLQNKPKPLVIEPENNMIVFFDSSLIHAVHPVSCPTKQFEHGRFTLNGWIRKKAEINETEGQY